MKICFLGVGGVGGYFGTLVTDRFDKDHDIYFIARGSHKEAILANGLTLKKDGGAKIINVKPKLCTDNLDQVPLCDIVIISVKGYDLENAVNEISNICNEKTLILPLLNGVDIYERIRKHMKTGIVLPSCVYVGTHIEGPGVIYQKGGSCKISMGRDPEFPEIYPETLLKILEESGIDYVWEDKIELSIWSKYIFIAAFGLVTASYGKTIGEILEDHELSKITNAIMAEIFQLSTKLKIGLPSNIVESSFSKAKEFPYETKTSFQRDVELKGKINEGDLFGGTLLRYGNDLNIPTPNIQNVYERLNDLFQK